MLLIPVIKKLPKVNGYKEKHMNLFLKFAALCSVGSFALYSMDNDRAGVIPKASYFVYEGN
jgi:hypothetical protein